MPTNRSRFERLTHAFTTTACGRPGLYGVLALLALLAPMLSGCGDASGAKAPAVSQTEANGAAPSPALNAEPAAKAKPSAVPAGGGVVTPVAAVGASEDELPPTASIAGQPWEDDAEIDEEDGAESAAETAVVEPAKGSPEWLMREILQVKLRPLPSLEAAPGEPALTAEQQATRLQEQVAARRDRNEQVVKLAMEAIAKTAKDKEKDIVFNAAVHHLLEARLQLALTGDTASVDALYEAADVFYNRDPQAPSAAEAQFILVQLAHSNAVRAGDDAAKWIGEFARQAQVYATKFPTEQQRSVPLVLTAARSSEAAGQLDQAKTCYALLQSRFPDHPLTQQSVGVLRRLQLVGQPLQFGGPTIDGHHLSIDEYQGKTVVIVYWASVAKPFVDNAAALAALSKKYEKYASFIGVNLDTDESAVDRFLEQSGLSWPQIFHPEPNQRGWSAPLAMYYGVISLPTIWIVDPTGVVAETNVAPAELESKLRAVILKHRAAGGQTTNAAKAQAEPAAPAAVQSAASPAAESSPQ